MLKIHKYKSPLLYQNFLLQYTNSIRRTGDPAREIQRRAREEETPLLMQPALFRQFLQIKHFTDGRAPEGEEGVVEAF